MVYPHTFREKRCSLYFYFAEAKNRLISLLFSFAITLGICYFYSLELIFLYVKPFLVFEKPFIFTELTEALYITLKICAVSGLYAISPFLCYQTWCFILPSCYCHERNRWTAIFVFNTALAIIGWLGVYFFVLPKLSAILLQFEIKNPLLTIQLEARITSYIKWSSQIFLAMGIACQLPFISYIAFMAGTFNPKIFSRNRRAAFLGCLVLSAFISPPDLLVQWLTTLFLFSCFECILWLGMVFKQVINKSPP